MGAALARYSSGCAALASAPTRSRAPDRTPGRKLGVEIDGRAILVMIGPRLDQDDGLRGDTGEPRGASGASEVRVDFGDAE
jgi:hypothetical protein